MQVEITNEEANDLADDILLRGEFIPARDPGFFRQSINQVFEWIGEFLEWLFGGIFGSGAGGGGIATIIAFVLAGIAVVLIVVAIVHLIRSERSEIPVEGSGTRVVFDEVVDPEALRRELGTATASGDWRAAVIAGFRLAIVDMIDRRIVAERPGATTGDFGRALRTRESMLASAYDPASASFERAFYSDAVINAHDLEAVRGLLRQLEPVGAS